MKSVSRGIIALIIVTAILLFSDLRNRNVKSDSMRSEDQAKSETSAMVRLKLALVQYNDSPNSEDCEKGLRKALEDKNLREGDGFTLKVFNAQGDISTLNSIAGTIANETWDLVFASSTPTVQLLSKKLTGIKIVFTNVGDPQAAGLGQSFEDHLPNLCGISTMSDFEGLVKLVSSLHPGLKRAGTVFTPGEINSVSYKDRLTEAAKKKGIELIMGIEVLSGKNPAGIPYRFVEKTDYLISLETAKLFNISVPDQVFKDFPKLKIIEK